VEPALFSLPQGVGEQRGVEPGGEDLRQAARSEEAGARGRGAAGRARVRLTRGIPRWISLKPRAPTISSRMTRGSNGHRARRPRRRSGSTPCGSSWAHRLPGRRHGVVRILYRRCPRRPDITHIRPICPVRRPPRGDPCQYDIATGCGAAVQRSSLL
jgi:hypothetical protein